MNVRNRSQLNNMRVVSPKSGTLEQGAIFNCLRVPGYEGCRCSGLVLTARCDLAHCKQSVVNYLPVVKLNDWITRDYCKILVNRLRLAEHNTFEDFLTRNGVSKITRQIFPIAEVIEKELNGKAIQAAVKQLEVLHLLDEFSKGEAAIDQTKISEMMTRKPSDSKRIICDLVKQLLPEYYYLNCVDISSPDDNGYVVLLRGMTSAPTSCFEHIVNGVESDAIGSDPTLNCWLYPDGDPICLVTGVLRSPDIEHLAQSFSNLFVRIGLEDQDPSLPDRIFQALSTNTSL